MLAGGKHQLQFLPMPFLRGLILCRVGSEEAVSNVYTSSVIAPEDVPNTFIISFCGLDAQCRSEMIDRTAVPERMNESATN